jgi:hypothetical protein
MGRTIGAAIGALIVVLFFVVILSERGRVEASARQEAEVTSGR